MNREQRLNRPKRARIAAERTGNAAKANHSKAIEILAKDKTPKVQRVGNFFVKVKQGVRQQYTNVVPYNKLYTRKPEPGLFTAFFNMLKYRLGM